MTPAAVIRERRRMRRAGFRGHAGRVVAKVCDGDAHFVRVIEYTFRRRPARLFVEAWETHDRARRARITPLRDLVHVLQNVGEAELLCIAGRRRPARSR